MPNDTRSGLKSVATGLMEGGILPIGSITEVVWDHLDRKQNKRQPTSKEEL